MENCLSVRAVFRKGRSTVKTAYDLVNNVLLNKNKGLTSATAFIDIAKALTVLTMFYFSKS